MPACMPAWHLTAVRCCQAGGRRSLQPSPLPSVLGWTANPEHSIVIVGAPDIIPWEHHPTFELLIRVVIRQL
eukprot:11002240-Alexandrium_andersonii.AAC.1